MAKRYGQDFHIRSQAYKKVKKSRARGTERIAVPTSARADRAEAQGRESTWKRAAEQSARLCQRDGPEQLPPCYAGLDQ